MSFLLLVTELKRLNEEFINLSEPILCKLEKKLCRVFKEVLENRENSRRLLDTFSVKQNVRRIQEQNLVNEYGRVNSSYKQVIHNLSNGARHARLLPLVRKKEEDPNKGANSSKIVEERFSGPRENPLVNKEFYCVEFEKEKLPGAGIPGKLERKRFPGGLSPVQIKKSAKVDDGRNALYFLNEHNQKTEGVESLLKGTRERFITRKPKKQNIYRMLAMNPRAERKEDEPAKQARKNTAFQNVKRILSRTEDEKHELDVRILQFQKVHEMLAELKIVLFNEENENQLELEEKAEADNGRVLGENSRKIGREEEIESKALEIEDESREAENEQIGTSCLKQKTRNIFETYFREKVEKAKKPKPAKIREFLKIPNKKEILVDRIKRLKVLDAIYDSNKRRRKKIVETILKNLNWKVAERLRERVNQKLAVLRKVKSHLLRTGWKRNLINNYYKSLDVRSGSLQQNEKAFFSPKYFISNLIETEKQLRRKETWKYWPQILQPEVSLSSRTELDPFKETQNSDLINKSATFGGEDGMYDSLIKIGSRNQDLGETERNCTHDNDLVKSEVGPASQMAELERSKLDH